MTKAEVYSSLKVFRFPERLQAFVAGEVPAPVHVRIKPINRCNHHCWYCAYRADELQLGEDMVEADRIPTEKMFEIVDDLIAMDVKAVTFSGGGEPLLYKALPDVIDRLGEAGVRVACLTNGTNLKQRFAAALARHGTWVRVSVDAWDDVSYARSRGAPKGAFTKLLDNIHDFTARATNCVLGISFIVGEENHTRIAEVCRLFREAGAAHVKLSGAVVANDVIANNAYHARLLEPVGREIARARELESDDFRIVDHYHKLSECFEKPYTRCPSMTFLTVIGADQAVYTCQDKAYTRSGMLGSIRDVSFRTFWFSDKNRRRLAEVDPRRDCRHHCVGHAKNLAMLDFFNLDPDHAAFV